MPRTAFAPYDSAHGLQPVDALHLLRDGLRKRFDGQRFAGDVLDEFAGSIALPVAMDVLTQPGQ